MTATDINQHRFVFLCAAVLLVLSAAFRDAQAKDVVILHAFVRSEGMAPDGRLVFDPAGNLYGTTIDCVKRECGTLFKLSPEGTESTIHTFIGKTHGDGTGPSGALLIDKAGFLYGTTINGGTTCVRGLKTHGCGTIFQIATDGMETILHAFKKLRDGIYPSTGVIADKHGNLYGTTQMGGISGCPLGFGCGVIFQLSPTGDYKVLHAFAVATDGGLPSSGLISDEAGNLYGETEQGGSSACSGVGCGTVYKLAPDGTFTVLYAFAGGIDGAIPGSGLLLDKLGNLYGATGSGGGIGCASEGGCGTVFKLSPDGTKEVLHAFGGGQDGQAPGGLIADKAGNLYGETAVGGGGSECSGSGCGTLFELEPDGTEAILHVFTGGSDGARPSGGLIFDKSRNLFGTTLQGGGGSDCGDVGCGTVFELKH